MKLYEFEGQAILKKVGIAVPLFVVISSLEEARQAPKRLKFPIVAKLQVLAGGRGRAGGVKIVRNRKQLLTYVKQHLGKSFLGEEVHFIVLAQAIDIKREYYISITYDTTKKVPFILFSVEGGVDIEEVKKSDPAAIIRVDIDPTVGPKEKDLKKMDIPFDFALRLWDAFTRFDCRLVEVNPLALVRAGEHPGGEAKVSPRGHPRGEPSYVAIDAKVILDDAGLVRHRDLDVLPKGAVGAIPSEREILAKQIDEADYRGTAGSTFIEFDGLPRFARLDSESERAGEAGDIAILASGGGASLLVMDVVATAGGKPANYTEYSGNPPAEKVEKLTKITLAKEGLSGCLVAGAVANFTDIYETLSGFVAGLRQVKPKPKYPIVIRRGGPRQKEAYEMLAKFAKKEGYDIHLFGPETPISVACRKMVELSEQFKIVKGKFKN